MDGIRGRDIHAGELVSFTTMHTHSCDSWLVLHFLLCGAEAAQEADCRRFDDRHNRAFLPLPVGFGPRRHHFYFLAFGDVMVVNLWSSDLSGSSVVDLLHAYLDSLGARATTILFSIPCCGAWLWASTFETAAPRADPRHGEWSDACCSTLLFSARTLRQEDFHELSQDGKSRRGRSQRLRSRLEQGARRMLDPCTPRYRACFSGGDDHVSASAALDCVAKNAMLCCDSVLGRRQKISTHPPTPMRCSSGLRAFGCVILSASPGLRLSLTCQDARDTHEMKKSPPK